ncbi:hypothetical protein AJ85_13335 [Alkalihalobacillus alcalophilus ATCC 27647 = CGMCC 1.3604]|uniref:DUF2663 family protein n=1 Tax=Alkalihalobacillus alcalophilus ATCC 27647 = CGMCC 1.3604 TaxID=1218173 RepID=A0A4S4JXY8_ALKAL|nr:DUF2663 family protein [Alkalihalobacillus alcalophilus]MED1561274.1 DUF2663 family protein [Alkalihalobacillus alcalophilus]THG90098.1 hypothetical protein AJ85_13335 [Alkalihalobacillus alcalophilus ATCC 27647 = CGMCC 1.3604]
MKRDSTNSEVPAFFDEMLQELIKRKKKLDKMEKSLKIWSIFVLSALAIISVIALYSFLFGRLRTGFSYHQLLQMDSSTIFLILLLVTGIFQVRYFQKKEKKAEKEFEELRFEMIDKSPEIWNDDIQWKKRHRFFKAIEKRHDINLFYK